MTASALKMAKTTSASTLRPLLALLIRANRSVCIVLADFNRYMDAAHRVHDHVAPSADKYHS